MTARLDAERDPLPRRRRQAAADPVPGKLLSRMPADGLDVGSDRNGAVGPYSSPYPYSGTIKAVVIEIDGR